MSELDEFVEWCIQHGHYQGPPLVVNFRAYKKSLKDRDSVILQSLRALRKRTKGSE